MLATPIGVRIPRRFTAWAASTTRIAVLEEFVRLHDDSHYAALARARTEELTEELRKSQAAAQTAAQTTVPPGFDAVPRPPSVNGENITPPLKSTRTNAPMPGANTRSR